MSDSLSMRAFALFALALLIAPAAFMAYAPQAKADTDVLVGDTTWQSIQSAWTNLKTSVETAFSAVKDAITAVASVTSAAKETALVIERYVLQPLAYITTGNLLKKITSSILGFVGGKNGLGKPLYADTRPYIQNVGDVEAATFLSQFQSRSNSPFKSAIASSLRANYLQGTSLAGFFAANKSTLSNYSSNPKGFTAGNWGLGGWMAFLGLATVDQNNPYTYSLIAQDRMRQQVNTADTAKLTQLMQNQGFLNWCGTAGGTPAATSYNADGTAIQNDNFKTSLCTDFDTSGNCISTSGVTTGETISLDCPADTVAAGSICGCQKASGCYDSSSGTLYDNNTYVLPTGDSCPDGSKFDNYFGGCEYTADGTWTAVQDADGNPVFSAVLPSNDTGGPAGADSAAKGSGNVAQILTSQIDSIKGANGTNFANHLSWTGDTVDSSGKTITGGRCLEWAREAECAAGQNTCTGAGQSGVTLFTGADFTSSTVTNPDNLPTGALVGINCGSVGCDHWQIKIEPKTINKVTYTWASDTYQQTANAYADKSRTKTYTYFAPPSKTALGKVSNTLAYAAPQPKQVAAAAASYSSVATRGQVLADTSSITDAFGGSRSVTTGALSGLKPGDPCTKSDGTAGKVQTPGSIIKDYLSAALKATSLDKLVAGAGDLSTQISGILGDIGTVMKTIDVASNLFGGSSSGLLAFSGDSAYTSPFASYLNSSSYMGLTTSSVYSNPATQSATGGDLSLRVTDYKAAWDAIGKAANEASSTLTKLVTNCSTTTQSSDAQTALDTYVTPVFANWATAKATIAAANKLIDQTATDLNSTTDNSAYTNDVILEQSQAPSAADVAAAQADATVLGTASANPSGSLVVSGGAVIDQLNLLNDNGKTLSSSTSCTAT